jgi:hypothetical protein
MKFKKYLKEEYYKTVNAGKQYYDFSNGNTEVFVNPSNKEIRDIIKISKFGKYLRFIISMEDKKLFIFKDDTFHSFLSRRINKGDQPTVDNFWGSAEFSNGKLDFYDTDAGGLLPFYQKWHGKDDWTTQYFNEPITDQLNSYWKQVRNRGLDEEIGFGKLSEEWFKKIDVGYSRHEYVDIFSNPSVSELGKMVKESGSNEIRFIVNFPKKKILVWPAELSIHSDVEQGIDKKYLYDKYNWKDNFWGLAKFENGKLNYIKSDELNAYYRFRIGFIEKWKGKDGWTKKYFGDSIINIVKDKYEI